MEKNTALVLQGGGMRGIYTAGVLDFLMHHQVELPYVIGTSAGALNACSYVSNNPGRSKTVMTKYMRSAKFASLGNYLLRGNYFDFEYLFYEVAKVLPFDWDRFNSSPIRLLCACTSFKTGEVVYFEKGKDEQFLKGVAASSSLPATIRKPVMVAGKPYCDGGPVCSIPFRKPLEDGCQKLVIICTQMKGHRKSPDPEKLPIYMRRYVDDYPEFVKAFRKWSATYNQDMDEIDKMGEEGKAFVIYPSQPPNVSVASRDKKAAETLYELGKKDMEKRFSELLDYLKKDF